MTLLQQHPLADVQFDPVEEVLHGMRVVDPYRCLEDRDSAAAANWITLQQTLHDAYFSNISRFDWLRARVTECLDVEVVDQPAQVGSRRFYRRREKDHEQACIYVSDRVTGKESLLVDPSAQGPFASVAIHRISDDGSLLAYEVKQGGRDIQEIKVVQVESGSPLPDAIPSGLARGFAFTSDNTGYYYCHESLATTKGGRPHEIRCHQFGTRVEDDRILFHAPRTPRSRLVLTHDAYNLGAVLVHDHGSDLAIDLYLASRVEDQTWKAVFTNRTTPYGPFLEEGRIFVQSHADTPNGQVVELDDDGTELRVVVPECYAQIQGLAIASDRIYVHYVINLATSVRCWTLTGQYLGALDAPQNGSFTFLPSYGGRKETFFYSNESFTDPPRIIQYCPQSREHLGWPRQPALSGTTRYTIQQVSYPSKDGSQIPISLLMLKDSDSEAGRPALLTAYGGFGVCMTPRFSVLVKVMLDLGAIFAIPNIRGGSEFGSDWHNAARRQSRQAAYDDFIAAAEWLCERGLTNPSKLAIFGGSNSGLLVGVAMTQRPDLFRAVLCVAPILDMVRYELLGNAHTWREEYGTVEDAGDFGALYAYSPYHHVQEDVNYPSTLFVCGAKDDRCCPAHVWKMSARLQLRSVQTNPILVDYSTERGHSPVLPLSVRVDALTRRVQFLCQELGIPAPTGVVP